MPSPQPSEIAASLTEQWGVPVEVSAGQRLGAWSIARFHIVGGPHSSVVVKWVRDGSPDIPAHRAAPSQLTTESTALQFLAAIEVPAPAVIVTTSDLMIMEDLGSHRPLDRLIIEDGHTAEARRLWKETGRVLAHRHGATADRSDEFFARFVGHARPSRERELGRFLARGWERTHLWAGDLGCAPAQRTVEEALEIRRTLLEPGPFLALSNGDSTANNVLVTKDSVMVIDYEFAGYRHCLTDLVDFFLPGPRFVTVDDGVTSGFEDAYREELAHRIPEVADDNAYREGLAAAGLTHAFIRLASFDTCDNRPHGDLSRLERLNVLERAADLAESRHAFPRTAEWCRTLANALRHRWPDADIDMRKLPPFLPRT